ncbi:MAG: dihydrolipoyl dehydrogenase family protein [Woeseia sp.]
MKSFDLVVIGAGTAAMSTANKCASTGWSVAIVDELPYGGTCALRGCDPKKMLRRGAELVDAVRLMRGKGVETDLLRINWPDLMAFKRTFTDKMPDRVEGGLTRNGVETFHGTARFVDHNSVDIDGEILEGRYILIATGARPRDVQVAGAEYLIDSTKFMELEALPKHILFVGGGFISFEFAHIAAHAGSAVHIIDHGARPLKAFDPDLVDKLIQRTENIGIEFHPHSDLRRIEQVDDGFTVTAARNGNEQNWGVDLVVHGAGRVAALDRLDLEAANVESSDKGVRVNEYLQSVSNPAVYAAGDSSDTDGWPLTPVSFVEGRVAAANMLKGNNRTADYRGVPTAVFTVPELTRVGFLESEATELDLDYRVKFTDTGGWYSNMRVGEDCAAVKVLIDNQKDEILGAHLFGPEYAELVNTFGLAIKFGLKTADLKKMVSAYPSVGSDLASLI